MFIELKVARKRLEHALEQYLTACTTVRNYAEHPMFSHTREHSARMASEMTAIVACQEKMDRAKKCISQAINHSPFVARVNSLPDEILARIFHIAIGLQPCFTDINDSELKNERKRVAFAQVPERLSHVCCRWRRLAFSLSTLWQHIDINMDATDALARAKARMTRTGRLLLDVHIIGSLLEVEELEQWFALAAPRTKSLTMIICDVYDTHESVLTAWFRHCSPGTFSHLTVWKEIASGPDDDLILDFRNPFSYNELEFEEVFRRLESLRLRQLYPYWTSPMFRGLTELHLASHQLQPSQLLAIAASQLIGILQSSPKLRVLRLDLKVVDDQPGMEALRTPVRFEDLEVLDLSTESRQPDLEQLELLLPLIIPGTKPLQLTINELDEGHLILEEVVQAFFARSNVTRLKLVYDGSNYSIGQNLLREIGSLAKRSTSRSFC
ncbi:F-box-like domain protein [Rhizoctonia solani 123E]|uniref:F-box-like domain protein n=1 Tax=Rhizoctonia solani 123E TaxID=1423351 RepID=A0A074RM26_9AGAM|nr:F-box-like domain protein [Rhizoctonia solani 123E]